MSERGIEILALHLRRIHLYLRDVNLYFGTSEKSFVDIGDKHPDCISGCSDINSVLTQCNRQPTKPGGVARCSSGAFG